VHAAAGARVGETPNLRERGRLRLVRTERRVALDVPLHEPRLEDLSRRERRAADHALDVCGEDLLVAEPVLHRRDAAVCEGMRGRADRRFGVHRLRRDDAEVAGRQLARVGRGLQPPHDLTGAGEAQPTRVDRVDVLPRRVVRPHLDVVELREVRREQGAHRPAAHHTDPHPE